MWFDLSLLEAVLPSMTSQIGILVVFFPELLPETQLFYEFSSASGLETTASSGTFYDYFPFGTATMGESKIGPSISRLFAFESVFVFLIEPFYAI